MKSAVIRPFLMMALLAGASATHATPVLKSDYAAIAEGGNVVIDVLANDTAPDGTFNIGSMYISSEATNGYLGIDAQGRVSYTHYGGPTTADTFSYVISDSNGVPGKPAVVLIKIGDGPAPSAPAATNNAGNASSEGVAVAIPKQQENKPVVRKQQASTQPAVAPPANTVGTERLSAFHRSGQTFLTWPETGPQDGYHVYRHSAPINRNNIGSATKLTAKWGALGSDTSVNTYGGDHVPDNFVISDLAAPLSSRTGLFVYTTQPSDVSAAYYAVTSVKGGRENMRSLVSLDTPVAESVATPVDVLTVSGNGGKGRIYTQFMDYSRWNPTFNGYAYNYAVALPVNYNPKKQYPLFVELHAYQEPHKYALEAQYGWQVIQLFPSDPGPSVGAQHSWWYGYSANHDYRSQAGGPTSGVIENFTEQRVMRAIDRLASTLSVEKSRIYGAGNSMGASGLLALGIRYGSVFTGIYANEPMTNYASSPQFAEELVQMWGAKSRNLPIVNRGPHSGMIRDARMGVWDWMNHQQQLVQRRGTDMAFMMTLHGKQDQIIDWHTQGKPFVQALTKSSAGFTARYEDVGHTWVGFSSAIESLFGFGYDEHFPYKYPLDMSFPGIQRASGSGPLQPGDSGADAYNMNIEWATPHTRFGSGIVDKSKRYEITLRSLAGKQTANITPRRTRNFNPAPGQRCQFKATGVGSGESAGKGVIVVDNDALATAENVSILPGSGTRLTISCR